MQKPKFFNLPLITYLVTVVAAWVASIVLIALGQWAIAHVVGFIFPITGFLLFTIYSTRSMRRNSMEMDALLQELQTATAAPGPAGRMVVLDGDELAVRIASAMFHASRPEGSAAELLAGMPDELRSDLRAAAAAAAQFIAESHGTTIHEQMVSRTLQ